MNALGRRSRLDSFIDRIIAQREVLDLALREVEPRAGVFIELGLGNGRTFDHLRMRAPGRRIIAFDRALVAHPACRPAADDLVLGEIAETAAAFARRHGALAVLIHADIGTSLKAIDDETRLWLPGVTAALARPGAEVLSELKLRHPELAPAPLPPTVPVGRYFRYRRT